MASGMTALSKTSDGGGGWFVHDSINGTTHHYTKEEWDNPGIDKGFNDGPGGSGDMKGDLKGKKGRK